MIRLLALMLMMTITSYAVASPWLAMSYGFRFERDSEETDLVARRPLGFLFGHRFQKFTAVAEYVTFSTTTGNSTYSIARRQNLYLLSARLHPFENEEIFSWYPYFSGGLGAYNEVVDTTLLGMTDTRDSKLNLVGSAGVGVFGLVVYKIRMGAEFRILAARDFDPQAMLDLSLRLGYEF